MSPASLMYLAASFIFFLAERAFSTNNTLRYPMWMLAALLVVMTVGWLALRLPNHAKVGKMAIMFLGISLFSVPLYFLSQGDFLTADKSRRQFATALECLSPLFWLVGALPAINLSRAIYANPTSVHPLRAQAAFEGGLAVALGIGMLFPLNYLAAEYNKKWDFGFFKTTSVSDSTRLVVDNAPEPLTAMLFFPDANDVLKEVRPYFEDLAGENLTVEVHDQAMEPELAKKYKVRKNGTIAIIRGDRTETVQLDEDMDKARKDLRKLDSKVHTALLKLASDKKTAYFTVGHDEMFWKNAPTDQEKIDLAKKALEGLNFKVKELGVDDGLASQIPEDAAIVFIVGPQKAFLPEEIRALEKYRDEGGAFFVMLEPGVESPDAGLANLLGIQFNNTQMVTDKAKGYFPVTGGLTDRAFVYTNKFTSHESISDLSKRSTELVVVTPGVGSISEAPSHTGKYTSIIKGMPDWWADGNGNYEFNPEIEKKGSVDIGAVITGPASDNKEWHALVMADATWLSNLVVVQVPGNQVLFTGGVGWLSQDPAIGGETESEEDVKIQHNKEGQQWWFFGAAVGVPALVMMIGALNVRRRMVQA